jgi:glycosyltransferase involved in cell wall biosynthesis
MKIAFIIPSFDGGGAERVMVNLANGFASQGSTVYLIVFNNNGVYKKELSDKIQIIDINTDRALFSYFAIKAVIKKENFQILFSTIGHVNILLIILKLLNKKNGFRIVIRESNTSSQLVRSNLFLKLSLLDVLRKLLYPNADLIVAPSRGVATDLVHNYKIKRKLIEVVRNPINLKRLLSFSKKPIKGTFIDHLSSKIIIGIGALTKQKDFKTLIRAFSVVKKTHNCKLIILGEGPERQTLENVINELNLNEHVYMPGFVTNPFNYLKTSEVFVLSSIYEGLPNVLIQAMLLGIPCVSTNCKSGPKEILMNGKYGQLIEAGDQLGMSKAIINVLEERWESKSKNGLEKKYNLKKIVNHYLELPVFKNENN